MKIKKLNEDISPENKKYKDQFEKETDINKTDSIAEEAINKVTGNGSGTKIKKLGVGMASRFINALKWEELNKDNLFVKLMSNGKSDRLLNDSRVLTNVYNGYVHDLYNETSLKSSEVLYDPELWKNSNNNIDYILTIDNKLSNGSVPSDIVNIIKKNINTIPSSKITYEVLSKEVDSNNFKNLKNNIFYENDNLRDINSIKKIVNNLLGETNKKDLSNQSNENEYADRLSKMENSLAKDTLLSDLKKLASTGNGASILRQLGIYNAIANSK